MGMLPGDDPDPLRNDSGAWNLKAISPYIGNPWPGGSKGEMDDSSIIYCPSSEDVWRAFHKYFSFSEMPYAYFGGLGDIEDTALVPNPDDLCGKAVAGGCGRGRVLMAETMYYWSPVGSFDYNHGSNGPTYHYPGLEAQLGGFNYYTDMGPIPQVAGMNTLMGDGSCWWQKASEMEVEKMNGQNQKARRVGAYHSTGGQDEIYY
jgi:hypothetical protein